jgi:hypothetical protein
VPGEGRGVGRGAAARSAGCDSAVANAAPKQVCREERRGGGGAPLREGGGDGSGSGDGGREGDGGTGSGEGGGSDGGGRDGGSRDGGDGSVAGGERAARSGGFRASSRACRSGGARLQAQDGGAPSEGSGAQVWRGTLAPGAAAKGGGGGGGAGGVGGRRGRGAGVALGRGTASRVPRGSALGGRSARRPSLATRPCLPSLAFPLPPCALPPFPPTGPRAWCGRASRAPPWRRAA